MDRNAINALSAVLVIAGVVALEAFALPGFGSSPGLDFTVGLVFVFMLVAFGILLLVQRPYAPGILSTLLGALMLVLSLGFIRSDILTSPYFAPGVLMTLGGVLLLLSAKPAAFGSAPPKIGPVSRRTLLLLGLAAIVGSFGLTAAFEWEYWAIPDCFLNQGIACGLPILLAEGGLGLAVAAIVLFVWMAWASRPPRVTKLRAREAAP